jgi:hypothetical protein
MADDRQFWRVHDRATDVWAKYANRLSANRLSASLVSVSLVSANLLFLLPPIVIGAPPPPPVLPTLHVSQSFSWGDLLKLLAPRRTAGGSRTYAFCWVTMSEKSNVTNWVATSQPNFYWQSGARAIGVRIAGENQPFWKQTVLPSAAAGIAQIHYDGEPLEAGVEYELVSYLSSGLPGKIANFQVLPPDAQRALQDQLKPLTGKDEGTLLKRLTVYSEQQLTTDALSELLADRAPSPTVKNMIRQVIPAWCPSPAIAPPSIDAQPIDARPKPPIAP